MSDYGTFDTADDSTNPVFDVVHDAVANVVRVNPSTDDLGGSWKAGYDQLSEVEKRKAIKEIMKYEILGLGDGSFHAVTPEQRQRIVKFLILDEEDWARGVLAQGDTDDNDETPLHSAIELDFEARKKGPKGSPTTRFAIFLCNLMSEAIAANRLSKVDAAAIVSKKDRKLGATPLHLALMRDMPDVSVKLIELADRETFECRRENGNTPLHDAVDFRFSPRDPPVAARFLIQAPRCRTAALQIPMSKDFSGLVAQANEKSDKSRKTDPSPGSCCERCLAIDRHYQRHKAQHSDIICSLLEKGLSALQIANDAGESPYVYHVQARDRYRKAHPQTNEKVHEKQQQQQHQRKGRGHNLKIPAVTMNPRNPVKDADLKAEADAPSAPNIGIPRCLTGTNTPGPGTTWSDCQPATHPDCFLLSASIEELLWKSAFGKGGYEFARKCLQFPVVETVTHSTTDGLKGEDDTGSNHYLHQTFKPNKSVTASTTENYQHFRFRPTMVYVHLRVTPDHDLDEERMPLTVEKQFEWREKASDALVDLFEWLTGKKKVKRILKLVVEDNFLFPCSELKVQECLRKLQDIRYLDWRRSNISVPTLTVSPNLVEVWLYSTGINAVLCGWADMGGLQTLKLLRTVNLDAKQGVEPKEANKTNVKNFKDRLCNWFDGVKRTAPEVKVTYETAPGALRGRGARVEGGGDDAKPLNIWLDDIARFAGRLQPTNTQGQENGADAEALAEAKDPDFVKLVIIDDGVEPEWEGSGGLGLFLSGHGFPHDMSNWAVAGPQKHGNRMATLITTVCPFVRLYVAKIDSTAAGDQKHPTFDVKQAVEAIWWAIGQQAEVISMSWNVLLETNDDRKRNLEDAINAADRAGILMFCAAREEDEITSVNKAWPSAHPNTFSIGAAHIYLGTKGLSGRDAQFFFPSQGVLDDVVNGGTSAATALAAGLASIFVYSLKKNQRNSLRDDEDKKKANQEEEESMQDQTASTAAHHDQRAGRERGKGRETKQRDTISNGDNEKDHGKAGMSPSVRKTLLSQATNGDTRGVLEKTFERLSTGEGVGGGKYVDVGALTSWETVSPATISEYCTSHLTKRGTKERRGVKK